MKKTTPMLLVFVVVAVFLFGCSFAHAVGDVNPDYAKIVLTENDTFVFITASGFKISKVEADVSDSEVTEPILTEDGVIYDYARSLSIWGKSSSAKGAQQHIFNVVLPDWLHRVIWVQDPKKSENPYSVSEWTRSVEEAMEIRGLVGKSAPQIRPALDFKFSPAPDHILIICEGKLLWSGKFSRLLGG